MPKYTVNNPILKLSKHEYVRLCTDYGNIFEGFRLPKGCIFGRIVVAKDEMFFVSLKPRELNMGNFMTVFVTKRSWNCNRGKNNTVHMHWNKVFVPLSHPIAQNIRSLCAQIGFIPHPESHYNPDRKYKLSIADRNALGLRYIATPSQRCRPMTESITWEENVYPLDENPLPVYYEPGKKLPPAAWTPFQVDESKLLPKNGLKIDPTKIRPDKKGTEKVSCRILHKHEYIRTVTYDKAQCKAK